MDRKNSLIVLNLSISEEWKLFPRELSGAAAFKISGWNHFFFNKK